MYHCSCNNIVEAQNFKAELAAKFHQVKFTCKPVDDSVCDPDDWWYIHADVCPIVQHELWGKIQEFVDAMWAGMRVQQNVNSVLTSRKGVL